MDYNRVTPAAHCPDQDYKAAELVGFPPPFPDNEAGSQADGGIETPNRPTLLAPTCRGRHGSLEKENLVDDGFLEIQSWVDKRWDMRSINFAGWRPITESVCEGF